MNTHRSLWARLNGFQFGPEKHIHTRILREKPQLRRSIFSAHHPDNHDNGNQMPSRKKIHIMGVGNIGTFVAHSLASYAPLRRPDMTLMFHHPAFYKDWNRYGRKVAIKRHGIVEQRTGFGINVLQGGQWHYPSEIMDAPSELVEEEHILRRSEDRDDKGQFIAADDEIIEHLILTLKTTQIENALKSVQHRITRDSSILFLSNGMGVLEEVNEKIWPNEEDRPNYLFGITSHGLFRSGLFESTQMGIGTTTIGVVRDNNARQSRSTSGDEASEKTKLAPSADYLIKTLTEAPELTCVSTNTVNLLQMQLEKLAVNCIINPLTQLIDCENGELLYHYNISRAQRLLLIEISAVICALPELQGVPGIHARFAPERLRTLAVGVATRTAGNISSMLQDTRQSKETEIDYINGYVVRRGEEVGVRCALNYLLVQLVHAKARVYKKRVSEEVPYDASNL